MIETNLVELDLEYSSAQHHIFFDSAKLGRFRIFPKGRRLGATRGAAQAFVEYMLDGEPCLWGDTMNGNIDRYVERYFVPVLKKLPPKIPWGWNQQKRVMHVGKGFTDFRSADRPENWEGFGYSIIFLNEAGIILADEYLYENAVLPMLIDNPKSTLIAAGTPKLMEGKGKLFKTLWQRCEDGERDYYGLRYTTYDNPFINQEAIDKLIAEIPSDKREQEIYGKFCAPGGAAILKAAWWKRWPKKRPLPKFEHVFQSYDTAYSEADIKTNSYSARTTWGVFFDDRGDLAVMLCEKWKNRVDYPDLKKQAMDAYKEYEPDAVLIEKRASGQSLIQDLRRSGLPVKTYQPDKSKTSRAYAVQAMFESGQIWAPKRRWADNLIEEVAEFPFGESDDLTDTVTQALLYVRNGLYLLKDEEPFPKTEEYGEDIEPPKRAAYG